MLAPATWPGNFTQDLLGENADLETLRILGIWTQRWVHVYGTRSADSQEIAP